MPFNLLSATRKLSLSEVKHFIIIPFSLVHQSTKATASFYTPILFELLDRNKVIVLEQTERS